MVLDIWVAYGRREARFNSSNCSGSFITLGSQGSGNGQLNKPPPPARRARIISMGFGRQETVADLWYSGLTPLLSTGASSNAVGRC